MSNILVVTPLMYQLITDPRYQTALNIMYSGHLMMRSTKFKRRMLALRHYSRQEKFGLRLWLKKTWRRFNRKRKSKFVFLQEKQGPQWVLTGSLIPPDKSKKRASRQRRKMSTPSVLTQPPAPTISIEKQPDYLSIEDIEKELLS